LPLSHVFGKALIAIQLHIGFTTAVDGRIDKIVENLAVVQPTFMCGAPRIFEKVRARVMTTASHGLKAKIFDWAFGVGRKVSPLQLAGQQPSGLLAIQHALADRLVFSKIKARMGGKIRFFVSGSAALNREVQEWFHAAGLLILEGYGLTETSAATCVNNPRATRFGTVGPPVPGSQVKIADDGEILIKGPGVMHGYHNLPEATAEAVTDGWFATGDIGELDEQGYLRITDRKKDLIKTSGGKYVAPQKVEGVLKVASPYISQVLVHGDGRKYATALITLDPEATEGWAKDQGLSYSSFEELSGSREVHDLIESQVAEANKSLERWETIKRFEILPAELSVEEGEVTPSLKIRRRAVEEKYADVLNSMYDSD
jgi:long-chain acyl-CoA synthetase